MRALLETNRPESVLQVSDELIRQEHDSVDLHRISAEAADRLGLPDRALNHRKQLWRLDREDVSTAMKVLESVGSAEDEASREWREELLYYAETNPRLAKALARHGLATNDPKLFAPAASTFAAHDPAACGDLLLLAEQNGLLPSASKALGRVLDSPNLPSRLLRALRDIGRSWAAQAAEAAERGDFAEASRLAVASAEALGEQHGGSRGLRAVAATMLTRARELAASEQAEQVVELCAGCTAVVLARPRLALELARALKSLGRTDEAAAIAVQAAHAFPEDLPVAMTAARMLEKEDVAGAADFYARVGELDVEGRHEAEVAQARERAARLATLQLAPALESGDFEKAARLVAVQRSWGDPSRAAHASARLLKAMQVQFKALDPERDNVRRQALLERMLELAPEDPLLIKQAATEAMRTKRFGDALGFWEQLSAAAPDDEAVGKGLTRCRLLLGGSQAQARESVSAG